MNGDNECSTSNRNMRTLILAVDIYNKMLVELYVPILYPLQSVGLPHYQQMISSLRCGLLSMEVREADSSLASQDAEGASVMPQDFICASHLTAYAARFLLYFCYSLHPSLWCGLAW